MRATVAMCAWAIMLILLADVGSETDEPLFDRLTNYCVFGGSIFYLSAVLAVFVLRSAPPRQPRGPIARGDIRCCQRSLSRST